MMNEARRIQASLESQSSLLREMKERVKRECDEQRDECKKYADGERKKLDKERGRLANERIKVSKLSASMSGGGDGDFARANTNANVDDSDGLGGWTHKALRQEVVGLKGTIVDLKRQVREGEGAMDERLEKSDSKCCNTPPTHITNNLPLVASLITG